MAKILCGGGSSALEGKIKCIKSQSTSGGQTFSAILDGDGLYVFASNSGSALVNGKEYSSSDPIPNNATMMISDWIYIENGVVSRIQSGRNPSISGSTLTWTNAGQSAAIMDLLKIL